MNNCHYCSDELLLSLQLSIHERADGDEYILVIKGQFASLRIAVAA